MAGTPATVAEWINAQGETHEAHIVAEPTDLRLVRATLAASDPVILKADDTTYPFCELNTVFRPRAFRIRFTREPVAVYAEARNLAHGRECSSITCIQVWRAAAATADLWPDLNPYRIIPFMDRAHPIPGLIDYPMYQEWWSPDFAEYVIEQSNLTVEEAQMIRARTNRARHEFENDYWPLEKPPASAYVADDGS